MSRVFAGRECDRRIFGDTRVVEIQVQRRVTKDSSLRLRMTSVGIRVVTGSSLDSPQNTSASLSPYSRDNTIAAAAAMLRLSTSGEVAIRKSRA